MRYATSPIQAMQIPGSTLTRPFADEPADGAAAPDQVQSLPSAGSERAAHGLGNSRQAGSCPGNRRPPQQALSRDDELKVLKGARRGDSSRLWEWWPERLAGDRLLLRTVWPPRSPRAPTRNVCISLRAENSAQIRARAR